MLYSIQNTYLIYSGKMYNWELIIYYFISISVVGAKPQIYYNQTASTRENLTKTRRTSGNH